MQTEGTYEIIDIARDIEMWNIEMWRVDCTTELKSFLELINYYHKFIPNLSSKLYSLYNLLKKGVKYKWNDVCQAAFAKSKTSLLEADFLEFYDPKKNP